MAIAYLVAVLLSIKEDRSLVLLGALLPDLFKLFIPIVMFLGLTKDTLLVMNLFAPFHTLFGVILSSAFILTFFEDIEWKNGYYLMLLGGVSHLLADLMIYPWGAGVWILWPFAVFGRSFGLFWSDSLLPLMIFGSLTLIAIYWERSRL